MPRQHHADPEPSPETFLERVEGLSLSLRLIAGVLIIGLLHLLSPVLVPFTLALVLAIALTPLADRIERAGLPRAVSSLACLLLVVVALSATSALLIRQAGIILRDSDEHLHGFSNLLAQATERFGGEQMLESFDMFTQDAPEGGDRSGQPAAGTGQANAPPGESVGGGDASEVRGQSEAGDPGTDDPRSYWFQTVRRNARAIGQWVISGLGGLLGFVGGVVVFLGFLFYMLLNRSEWVDRIRRVMIHLGMRPRPKALEKIRHQIQVYIAYLALVSVCYAVVVSLALWAIGVPQPILWGVLTGLLEVVPYFGPMISTSLPTIMALSTGEGWWQPLAVLGLYAVLQTFEGYVVSPLVYGSAVEIDPVTVLVVVLFFGLVWGPLGLAAALPATIIFRGLVAITPDTPALDALVDTQEKAEAR